jgi:hypothetical protein
MVMVAFAMTPPELSVTVPVRVPRLVCPLAITMARKSRESDVARMKGTLSFITASVKMWVRAPADCGLMIPTIPSA